MARSNQASIKISSDFLDEVRREAEVAHRSTGAQVEYWAKLGRAFEGRSDFTGDQAREALTGKKMLDGRDEDEMAGVWERVTDMFAEPDQAARDYFAKLGEQDGACGVDENGDIVVRRVTRRARRAA